MEVTLVTQSNLFLERQKTGFFLHNAEVNRCILKRANVNSKFFFYQYPPLALCKQMNRCKVKSWKAFLKNIRSKHFRVFFLSLPLPAFLTLDGSGWN